MHFGWVVHAAAAKGRNEGRREGRKEGRKEGKKEGMKVKKRLYISIDEENIW